MEELSEEELLCFLCTEGGKAKNSELLARYQPLINHVDPQLRAHHRQTFKEIINKVAVVKQEDREKYVILKKRYQPFVADTASTATPVPPPMCSRVQPPGSSLVQWEGESRAAKSPVQAPSPPAERASPKEKHHGAVPRTQVKDFSALLQSQLSSQWTGLHSVGWAHPVDRPSSRPDSPEGRGAKCQSAISQEDEEAEHSPKDIEQEVFEDGGSSVGSASVALDPVEKEWLQGAASGNFPALSQLLKQEPALAWKKDFTSGFTALHWAAKHGKSEMVTMLVNAGAEINSRDHGGYTPLHIAALHGHQQIMNLLISNYGAKESVRDYSGRLPAQYLKPEGSRDAGATHTQFQQARGERRNRKLASLFLAKGGGHSKKRWGSAEDLVEEEEEEEEKGNSHHLTLPTSYRPVRKFSR